MILVNFGSAHGQYTLPTSRSYDEQVNGGTPYEKGIMVDPSIGRKDNTSRLRTLMAGNRQPRLVVRLSDPTKEQKVLME
jgi:nephrocystin-1